MKSIPRNMRKRKESCIDFDDRVECVRNGHTNRNVIKKEVNKDFPEKNKDGWLG